MSITLTDAFQLFFNDRGLNAHLLTHINPR